MPIKKKTKKKTTKAVDTLPPIEKGSYTVVLSVDEMLSLVQILGFSKDLFDKMSETSHKEGKDGVAQVYDARSQLSVLLYEKLKIIAGIGEPTSREVH